MQSGIFVPAGGAALALGGGLALALSPWPRFAAAGAVLAIYGAFALAATAVWETATATEFLYNRTGSANAPLWAVACGIVGAIAALASGVARRETGVAVAGVSAVLVLIATAIWIQPHTGEPWLMYALCLCAMVALVTSGMLDDARPRIVAGWLGVAGVIASITWAFQGSLLGRSVFLAAAGAVAVALALGLNRLLPRADK
jgi:hypothetical protein